MANLITIQQAQQLPALAALAVNNPDLLTTLVSAASEQIQHYCAREFISASYTEYMSGMGIPFDSFLFPNFPVTSIQRVAAFPIPMLCVQNNNTTAIARATVEVTSTGINLRSWASGVETDVPQLTYASYPSLGAMAAAINAAGNSWQATVAQGYSDFSSSDLRIPQGQVTALYGGANLEVFTEQLPAWAMGSWAPDGTGAMYLWQYGWRLDANRGRMAGYFPQGTLNIRVDYTAGFAAVPTAGLPTLPQNLVYAAQMLTQYLYQATNHDFNEKSVKLGPYSKDLNTDQPGFPGPVRVIINRYRDLSKGLYTGVG